MNKNYYDKIADIMLFAVDFKEGDKLSLQLDFDCREAVKSLAYRAYERGAAFVDLRYIDNFLHAAAISAGKKVLEYPGYLKQNLKEISSPGWKSVSYLSFSEGNVYEDLPGDVSAEYFKGYQKLTAYRRRQTLNSAFPWTLTFIPTADTAVKVFPHLTDAEAVDAYWKQVIKIMKLDLDDPVQYWKEKFEEDAKRSKYLTELAPEYIEFKGPGTDIKIGLNLNADWVSAISPAQTGEMFAANIPTDEIFTSPDCSKAEGRVTLTRPFVMQQNLGSVPINAWFEFKDGRVVDYGADEGKNSLDTLFERDERVRYLGELALVDPHSPFAEAGLTFYNGLYDENAACHLALGAAYSGTLKKPGAYTDQQLLEMGMNVSAVHEDMMIGSTEVDVTAVCGDGRRVGIIRDGKFLI